MKPISLIIPAKNERLSLGEVLNELKDHKIVNEIIVIVDSAEDNSIPICREHKCKVVIQDEKGYGSAIIEGFKNASNEYGCIFNADYSFDPKYLIIMSNKTNENNFIFGSRYLENASSDDDDIITLVGNKCFSFFSQYFLKIKITDILYTYVLCDVSKFNDLKLKCKDFRLCVELPFKVSQKYKNYIDIPMHERARFAGKKNVNVLKDGFLILVELIKSFFLIIKFKFKK